MSKQALKYKLADETSKSGIKECDVTLPYNYMICDFEIQRGQFCIWVQSESYDTELVTFRIYGTGDNIEPNDIFVKTIHHYGWVWHLYTVSQNDFGVEND